MTPEQTRKVAELNDAVRHRMEGGRWVMTPGIQAIINPGILAMVAKFDQFTPDNNPHNERDLGVIETAEHTIMWKVDVFSDAECMWGADEPWNPDNSYRVLTIMLAEEW